MLLALRIELLYNIKINEKEERLQDKERQLIQMQQQIELLTEQVSVEYCYL